MPNTICDDLGLHCPEVHELMNRVPSAITRWGLSVMAIIMTVSVAIASFIEIPVTKELQFSMNYGSTGENPMIIVEIPPALLEKVSDGDRRIMLMSDAFPSEYNKTIPAEITQISRFPGADGLYVAQADVPEMVERRLCTFGFDVKGKALVTVSHTTVLRMLFSKK